MLKFGWRRPHARIMVALACLLLWCGLLIATRVFVSGSRTYAFLGWNLFLAAVPLFASIGLQRAAARGRGILFQILLFSLWLLFLPNAPYILTDLVHLSPRPPIPEWYDLVLLLSCAQTGLVLGYVSLVQVQSVVQSRLNATAGWIVALGSLLLCGYGIYLGRFQRWNSWAVVDDPAGLFLTVAAHLLDPLAHPRAMGVTLVFGFALCIGYVAFRAIAPAVVQDAISRIEDPPAELGAARA